MTRPALALAVLLSACGGEDTAPPMAKAGGQKAPAIEAAPITNDATPANVAAPEKAPPVSRETSSPLPRPAPRPRSADYRAIGTEPFWAVSVRGARATLERPDKSPVHYTVARQDGAQAIRYHGEGFAMTLTPGPCSDGMSDAVWSDRVQIAFADGVLKGCGGMREETP